CNKYRHGSCWWQGNCWKSGTGHDEDRVRFAVQVKWGNNDPGGQCACHRVRASFAARCDVMKDGSGMFRTIPAGHILGVDVHTHPTFALVFVFAFLQWGIGSGGGAIPFLLGCVLVVLVLLSVLAHELGHSLMARQFGIQVLDITLWPFSGI